MADVTPNYSLEILGMELDRSQLELNIKSQSYRIAQTQDEIRRININIEATRIAIDALNEKITSIKAR